MIENLNLSLFSLTQIQCYYTIFIFLQNFTSSRCRLIIEAFSRVSETRKPKVATYSSPCSNLWTSSDSKDYLKWHTVIQIVTDYRGFLNVSETRKPKIATYSSPYSNL